MLHALVLLGHGDAPDLAGHAGLPAAAVEQELADLATAGLASHVTGALTGWVATPIGRAEHRRLLADELDRAGGRDKVADAYGRFRAINRPFLDVCTDWDVRRGQPNDHTDGAYDARVVARLHDIDTAIRPALDDLEATLARFARYRPRLAAALAHVDGGERDWFTKPGVDSYHTVWFQLHEDLLATLDLERSQEETQ